MIREICFFCGRQGSLLFSEEKGCYIHTHCIVEGLSAGNQTTLAIAKEFDMVSDSSSCSVGCDECENKWCGRN